MNAVMIQMRIDEILSARGRSLYWLAKQSGVTYSTLWKLKTADTQGISFGVLDRICKALECEPGDLLIRLPDKKPKRGS